MTYKGYTIAAEVKDYSLYEVTDDGEVGDLLKDDYSDSDTEFCILDGDDYVTGGFDSIDEAKAHIDGMEQ